MSNITTVNFRGDTLFAVERDDGVFVAVKPICDSLGLAWQSQLQRLKDDPVLSEGITTIVMPSIGGPQETTCLKIGLVNGWLFKVDGRRVKDGETRQRLLTYQRECHSVLFDHFYGKRGNPSLNLDDEEQTPDGLKLRKVNTAIKCFGERAGAQLWVKLGLEWVPAMAATLSQGDMLDSPVPPPAVSIFVGAQPAAKEAA